MTNWYKRDPTAFLMGTMSLSFEQKGAYSIVLDLIYEKSGPIPDNDGWIAGVMGLSARKWRVLKNDLIEAGKISIENGHIWNVRAAEELEDRAKLSRKRADIGAKGGRTVSERSASGQRVVGEPTDKSLKSNDVDKAIASPMLPLEESRVDKSRKKKESSSSGDEVLVTKRKRKLRGKLLISFLEFWDAFDYKVGRAEAADAWLDVEWLDVRLEKILDAARGAAAARTELVQAGRTPKMAQGWITARRWEDAVGIQVAAKSEQTSPYNFGDDLPDPEERA